MQQQPEEAAVAAAVRASATYAVSPRYTAGEVEDCLHLLGGREFVSIQLASSDAVSALGRFLSAPFVGTDVDAAFAGSAPSVRRLLEELIDHQVLVEAPDAPPSLRPVLDEARRNGGDPYALGAPEDPSRPAPIAVVGSLVSPALEQAFWRDGSIRLDDPLAAELTVAVGMIDELREMNSRFREEGRTWLPIAPFDGRFQLIGPVIVPGVSPCFECVQLRWGSNTAFAPLYDRVVAAAPPHERDGGIEAVTGGFALRYALRWLFAHDWMTASTVLVLEPKVFSTTAHPVYRVARCSTCGPRPYAGIRYPWRS
ncbi:TOMM precursor leader peptide-binding protein [Microbacteriaceae bacterium 4G12]